MHAAIYSRFSSDLQSAASIADQERVCRLHAEREGWQVVETFADHAISGSTMLRPGYQNLIARLRLGGVAVVLAESLDRFSRDQEHIAGFFKLARFAGVRIITLSEGEISELHIGLKGTMGALYLKELAEKTRRGEAGRILKGRSMGGPAYGYQVVRQLAPDGELERGLRAIDQGEATIVRRIFREFANGASPLAIARALNAEGVPGPTGRLWYDASIRGRPARGEGILRNVLYTGQLIWNRRRSLVDPQTGQTVRRNNAAEDLVEFTVPHLRVIDQPLWDTVQARLATEAFATTAGGAEAPPEGFWERRRPRHLLTNKVFCGGCAGPFTSRGKDYLACHNAFQGACRNRRSIRRGRLEGQVVASLRRDLMAPDTLEGFIEAFTSEWKRLEREANGSLDGARRDLSTAERRLGNLVDAIADGLRNASLKQQLHVLETKCDALRAQIGAPLPAAPIFPANLAATYRQRVTELERAIADNKTPAVLEAARALIERVIVHAPPDDEGTHPIELVGAISGMLRAGGTLIPILSASKDTAGQADPGSDLFTCPVKKALGAKPRLACLCAPVDRQDGSGGVTAAGAGEEGDGVCDFGGAGDSAEGVVGEEFAEAFGVAEFGLGAVFEQHGLAFGFGGAGVDADDADAVFLAGVAEGAGEGHQAGVAGGAGDVGGGEFLAGGADDVDDDAGFARRHLRVDLPAERDEAEDLEVPGFSPGIVVHAEQGAGGNGAGVVDQEVDFAGSLGDAQDFGFLGEVGGDGLDLDLAGGADGLGGGLQHVGRAGDQDEVHALLGEDLGGGRTNALGTAGDEGALARKLEIHLGVPRFNWRAVEQGGGGRQGEVLFFGKRSKNFYPIRDDLSF